MNQVESKQKITDEAKGEWGSIYSFFGVPILTKGVQTSGANKGKGKNEPCPVCGGDDRFFADNDDKGGWFCRHGDSHPNYNKQAGDGFNLLASFLNISNSEAIKKVGEYLRMNKPNYSAPQHTEPKTPQSKPTNKPINLDAETLEILLKTKVTAHSYLINKGLGEYLVPVSDNKIIAPYITATGFYAGYSYSSYYKDKIKMINSKGSQVKDAFIVLTKERIITDKAEALALITKADKITLGEGLATGISLALINGGLVVVFSGIGNLKSTLEAIRVLNKKCSFIVGADNDINEKGENIGVNKAMNALDEYGGFVAIPPTDYKADWDDYRQKFGNEISAKDFNTVLIEIKAKERIINQATPPNQSGNNEIPRIQSNTPQNERAKILVNSYNENLAYDEIGQIYYLYNGAFWERIKHHTIKKKLVELYESNGISFASHSVNGVLELLELYAPSFEPPKKGYIYFNNGVYDIKQREFKPLAKSFFNVSVNGIEYTPPAGDIMDLEKGAPHFYGFLQYASNGDNDKFSGILAMLYIILVKFTKWAYFFEITGQGGTGKGTLSEIARLLVGSENIADGDLKDLEKKSSNRTSLINKSLLILQDQNKYISEGGLLKKISSGDVIDVDPKFKDAISFRPDMVILAVNNHPMTFNDPDSGLARRHIRVVFNEVVQARKLDINLLAHIKAELPFIVNHLLKRFIDLDYTRQTLEKLMITSEAEAIKRETDPIYDFYCYLKVTTEPKGLFIGAKEIEQSRFKPLENLYHGYESLYVMSFGKLPQISTREFTRQLKAHLHHDKKKFKQSETQYKGKLRTNLIYKDPENAPFLNNGQTIPLNR